MNNSSIPPQPAAYPETIMLEPGVRIECHFLRLQSGHIREGEERAMAILRVDGAERKLWLLEAALRGQMRECKPDPDERIIITKAPEKKESASGRSYWPVTVSAPERPSADGPIGWDHPLLADRPRSLTQTDSDDDIPF
jgi:hypothetical protein